MVTGTGAAAGGTFSLRRPIRTTIIRLMKIDTANKEGIGIP
jgi:hypothetical protein